MSRDGGIFGAFDRAAALLHRGILFLSGMALLAAAAVLCSSVVLRYLLRWPTDWQDEMAVFLLVGATFLCAAAVQAQRGHIGIDILDGVLPPRLNRLRRHFCDAASLLFCAFFAWKSWTLLGEAWAEGQTTSSAWAPPLWIPYGLMATGMTLLALQILLQLASGLAGRQDNRGLVRKEA